MVMSKKAKIITSLVVVAGMLAATPFVVYLKVLPCAVSQPKFISFVEKTINFVKYVLLKGISALYFII